MSDARITVRLNEGSMADMSAIESATGLPRADIIRVALLRLADAHRYMAAVEEPPYGYVADKGVVLTRPVRRSPNRRR